MTISEAPICATHRAYVYERGGTVLMGELVGMVACEWGRNRDDISTAQVHLVGNECCALVVDLGTVLHELHIYRAEELVWIGVITRLEFEYDGVDIYAEDLLWVAKRRVLEKGYDFRTNGISVVTLFHALTSIECYGKYGDIWNMVPGLTPINGPDDPITRRVVNAYQSTIWMELDKLAEDHGVDYTMVGRRLYYFDVHLKWMEYSTLLAEHISSFPRIVEYGNSFANRVFYTNGSGVAGSGTADSATLDLYGHYVDHLISVNNEGADNEPPSQAVLDNWIDNAQRQVTKMYPPTMSIVVPANSTLMPSCPWPVNDLIPGAWFKVEMDRLCRQVDEWQRLHTLRVIEDANGESVQVSCITAPTGPPVVP